MSANNLHTLRLEEQINKLEAENAALQAAQPVMSNEELAKQFHSLYEEHAPSYGYVTRKESAVRWEFVPENNKALMISVVGKLRTLLSTKPVAPEMRDKSVGAREDLLIWKKRAQRAERALLAAGFQDHGAQEWKPPLGKPPVFIEVPAQPVMSNVLTDDMRQRIRRTIFTARKTHAFSCDILIHAVESALSEAPDVAVTDYGNKSAPAAQITDPVTLQAKQFTVPEGVGFFNARISLQAAPAAQPEQQGSPQVVQSEEIIGWMLESTYKGESTGRRFYESERLCLLDSQIDGGICWPLTLAQSHQGGANNHDK